MKYILVINPGSTSTELAIFNGTDLLEEETFSHSSEELAVFENINDQLSFRLQLTQNFLEASHIAESDLACIVARGGRLQPIPSGTYLVDEKVVEDLLRTDDEHASNLGALIAQRLAQKNGINAYTVDPIVVDELEARSRITGHKKVQKQSIWHALNQKFVARKYAEKINKNYEESRLIVAHMGGGMSIAAHKDGRAVDLTNALHGEGPFSPERTGGLLLKDVIRASFSGDYTKRELEKEIIGQGGLVSYFQTNDLIEIESLIDEGDQEAKLVYEAMAYQVAKAINALNAEFCGEVDGIILTGGLAHSTRFTDLIKKRVAFIAPVQVYPGAFEMEALAQAGDRILEGETPKIYGKNILQASQT